MRRPQPHDQGPTKEVDSGLRRDEEMLAKDLPSGATNKHRRRRQALK